MIRAGLVADVALQLGGHLLDEHIAYICALELRETPFARAYQVLEVMPFNVKALKAWVKDHGVGRARHQEARHLGHPGGTAQAAAPRRRQERQGTGKKTATLVLTRIGEERVAIS